MKFLLKFLLLFSLIIIGKLVKEPVAADVTAKPAVTNQLPVHATSLLSRQVTLQGTTLGDNSQRWARKTTQVSNN